MMGHDIDCPLPAVPPSPTQVMTWDDHDIFDGWGSYPEKLQATPVFQVGLEVQGLHAIVRLSLCSWGAAAAAPAPWQGTPGHWCSACMACCSSEWHVAMAGACSSACGQRDWRGLAMMEPWSCHSGVTIQCYHPVSYHPVIPSMVFQAVGLPHPSHGCKGTAHAYSAPLLLALRCTFVRSRLVVSWVDEGWASDAAHDQRKLLRCRLSCKLHAQSTQLACLQRVAFHLRACAGGVQHCAQAVCALPAAHHA